MIETIDRSIDKLQRYLLHNDKVDTIYVLANTKNAGKVYIEAIKQLIDLKKYKIHYITDSTKDGINCNSVILLCGLWHLNKAISKSGCGFLYGNYCITISEIPSIIYLKETNETKIIV